MTRLARRAARIATTLALAAVLAVTAPELAYAGPHTVVVALAASVDEVMTNLRNWIMGVLAGLATVMWTVAGVRYIAAGGDLGEVEKAKSAFKAGAWGYGLAALAPLAVTILKGIVGA